MVTSRMKRATHMKTASRVSTAMILLCGHLSQYASPTVKIAKNVRRTISVRSHITAGTKHGKTVMLLLPKSAAWRCTHKAKALNSDGTKRAQEMPHSTNTHRMESSVLVA